jgi:hypothetical protein
MSHAVEADRSYRTKLRLNAMVECRVLHYEPTRSKFPSDAPDFYAEVAVHRHR